jgi:DNA polymerase-3 subunit epsilon
LCRRYEVDNTHRDLHGALLDAELLADVYLAMTGGQVDLQLAADASLEDDITLAVRRSVPVRIGIPVVEPTAEELAAHRANLEGIDEVSGGRCLWLRQQYDG